MRGDSHQGKKAYETTSFCWTWLSVPIFYLGFFDHWYLWKESIDTWDHSHGVISQGTVAYEIPLLVGCGYVSYPIRLQDSWINSISGGIKTYLRSFTWRYSWRGRSIYETTTFGLRSLVQNCVLANTIPGFFDHQYLWSELIDAFVWTLPFLLSFVIYSLASFIKLSGGPFSYSLLCTTITQFLRHITWINEIEKVLKTT